MKMRVDKAGHGNLPGYVNLLHAAIGAARADNPRAGDGNIAGNDVAGDKIKKTPAFEHQIRRGFTAPLRDTAGEHVSLLHVGSIRSGQPAPPHRLRQRLAGRR